MDTQVISRQEHDEFDKRMDAENNRQNKRIERLEENVGQINALTTSVEKMAVNMGNMVTELGRQGERLENLEKEPAQTNKQIRMAIITSTISAVIGAVVGAILMIL